MRRGNARQSTRTTVIPNGRVGGSLIPTRAFGDEYLKHSKYSCIPFEQYVPYITHVPEINSYELMEEEDEEEEEGEEEEEEGEAHNHTTTTTATNDDDSNYLAIVLASDGLWDVVTNEEVGHLTCAFIDQERKERKERKERNSLSTSSSSSSSSPSSASSSSPSPSSPSLRPNITKRRKTSATTTATTATTATTTTTAPTLYATPPASIADPANVLIWRALQTSATRHGITLDRLLRYPRGKARRSMLDDITVGVLIIERKKRKKKRKKTKGGAEDSSSQDSASQQTPPKLKVATDVMISSRPKRRRTPTRSVKKQKPTPIICDGAKDATAVKPFALKRK